MNGTRHASRQRPGRSAPRQAWAIDLLARRGKLTALELGRALHSDIGYHPADQTCDWCQQNGAQLLAKIAAKGHADVTDITATAPRRRVA